MARVGRPRMTEAQKDEVWRRWRTGESLSDIGRAIGRFPASIFGLLRLHGGMTPPARRRAARALTLAEREEVSRPEPRSVRLHGRCSVRRLIDPELLGHLIGTLSTAPEELKRLLLELQTEGPPVSSHRTPPSWHYA